MVNNSLTTVILSTWNRRHFGKIQDTLKWMFLLAASTRLERATPSTLAPDARCRWGRLSVIEDISWRLTQSVPRSNVGKRRSRVGMPGEILQIDDVGPSFAGDGQGRDTEGVHRDRGVEAEPLDVALDKILHGPSGYRARTEFLGDCPACTYSRPE